MVKDRQSCQAGLASRGMDYCRADHGLRALSATFDRLMQGDSQTPRKSYSAPMCRTAVVGDNRIPDGATFPLEDAGGSVSVYGSLKAIDGSLSSGGSTLDSVLVDVDGCGGIVALIDGLLQFRLKHPSIPLILASREVLSDDLSDVRLAISDATVKLPLSHARVIDAKSAALVNNEIWQDRLRDRLDAGLSTA